MDTSSLVDSCGSYCFDRREISGSLGDLGTLLPIALGLILIVMGFWRRTAGFTRHAYSANVALMAGGFIFVGYQLTGFFVS